MKNNHFFYEVKKNLPRVLSLIDNDKTSLSNGLGDRFYWAWGIKDFANGTFQGIAHGLSRLWVNNLWPYETSKVVFFNRIDSIFEGTRMITKKDGSMEEAFPNEGSYCVTALVAYDLLCTIELLNTKVNKKTILKWKT